MRNDGGEHESHITQQDNLLFLPYTSQPFEWDKMFGYWVAGKNEDSFFYLENIFFAYYFEPDPIFNKKGIGFDQIKLLKETNNYALFIAKGAEPLVIGHFLEVPQKKIINPVIIDKITHYPTQEHLTFYKMGLATIDKTDRLDMWMQNLGTILWIKTCVDEEISPQTELFDLSNDDLMARYNSSQCADEHAQNWDQSPLFFYRAPHSLHGLPWWMRMFDPLALPDDQKQRIKKSSELYYYPKNKEK